ncbi:MAG: hypothetical protein M1838_000373 [Thelocarpon superellum]|nr:MAG: hypothetical protein M1838_000373 [Thelocarpon superellum]
MSVGLAEVDSLLEHVESDRHERKADQAHEGPVTRFEQLAERGLVNEKIIEALTQGMRLETMTQVQSMTIPDTLVGKDVLAQARTGTGKTLAFLIPTLENILRAQPELVSPRARQGTSTSDILGLIISPTRELAEQIAVEARRATARLGVVVQTAVGGTGKRYQLQKMKREGCHLLVGTPGRLKDVLSDPYSGVSAPKLNTFVLDEADRLLDQGFWPDIQALGRLLPPRREVDRQTLMFSATVPDDVIQAVRETMKPDYNFIRTVQHGEEPTHLKVPQRFVTVEGYENILPTLLELCKREVAGRAQTAAPFKAIVYFNATALVRLAATTFEHLRGADGSLFGRSPLHPAVLVEMHARLSQQQRTRASQLFRKAPSAIMFSSDVSARGMDFPNVTHVIQVGVPPKQEDYIHRLGRTARGHNETGEGWVLMPSVELREMRQRLRGLPLKADTSLECAEIDMRAPAQLPAHVAETLTIVVDASKQVNVRTKAEAYRAALSSLGHVPAQQRVDALNNLATYGWGMETPPGTSPGLARKLGLSRVRGLNTAASAYDAEDGAPGFSRDRPDRPGFERRGGFGGRESRDRLGGGTRGGGDSFGGGGRSRSGDRGGRSGGFRGFNGDRRGGGERGERGGDRGGRERQRSY